MVGVEVRTDESSANEFLNLLEKNVPKVLIVHQTETEESATTEDEDEEER